MLCRCNRYCRLTFSKIEAPSGPVIPSTGLTDMIAGGLGRSSSHVGCVGTPLRIIALFKLGLHCLEKGLLGRVAKIHARKMLINSCLADAFALGNGRRAGALLTSRNILRGLINHQNQNQS